MAGDVAPPDHLSADDLVTLQKPQGWSFYNQPPALVERRSDAGELIGYDMNPKRENQIGPDDKYYLDQMSGKSREWINVYLLGRYGNLFEGRPVFPDFKKEVHVAPEILKPIIGLPVYIGIDFGLTPAAVFGQKWRGRWLILRELISTNMGMTRFAPRMGEFIRQHFPENEIVVVGDPAGDQRVQTNEETVFQILRAAGFQPRAASTNDPELRIAAVTRALTTMADAVPAYLISPCCQKLITTKEGGYHYKEGRDRPEKNAYSHVSDAEQYMMDGTGDLRAPLRGQNTSQKPIMAPHSFSPYNRRKIIQGFKPKVPWGS